MLGEISKEWTPADAVITGRFMSSQSLFGPFKCLPWGEHARRLSLTGFLSELPAPVEVVDGFVDAEEVPA